MQDLLGYTSSDRSKAALNAFPGETWKRDNEIYSLFAKSVGTGSLCPRLCCILIYQGFTAVMYFTTKGVNLLSN